MNKSELKERFTTANGLFVSGSVADSYMIFKELLTTKEPSVYVNVALCQMKVGAFNDALQNLDAALSMLNKTTQDPLRTDETYSKLIRLQAATDGHLEPMKLDLPSQYPKIAEEIILRIIADVCAETGNRERVERIAASLSGKGYSNIERALAKVRQ